ncbi:MAG TPA: endonuclease/exonuclease/phosphatase family protein [Verrucomicrobiae bacterium]|nr:endonuclease/exonuclease/phosphatase family protein [Verrucomicrobiae bacterium]
MRRAIACSIIGLFGLSGLTPAPAQQVKVMQYNIEGNLGSLSGNSSASAKAIARIVNYNQPDIITFNELAQQSPIANTAAGMIDWVTNNLTYFGNKTGVTFWVDIATNGDGSEINGSISRYPISNAKTYSDAGGGYANLRGMESFKVQLSGTNALQIFHVHLKASSTTTSCPRKQAEAATDATNMVNWASTNVFPYVFTGDCNESEDPRDTSECTITSTYHPITTLKQVGHLVEYEPTTLSGDWDTWSTGDPSPYSNIRFDHVLPSTNRISTTYSATAACIVTGYVFSTMDWAAHGLYTNASSQNLVNDSQTASDHYCVQVTYWFPTSLTNFNVTPATTFASSGNVGGPFSPSSQLYTVTNSDTIPLFWSVTKTSNWLTVSPVATNLDIGARIATNVTASINPAANSLSAGVYVDTINFSNTVTGVTFTRSVTLTVGSISPAALSVVPAAGVNLSGEQGGPFAPGSRVYSLTNTGGSALSWTAGVSNNWLGVSAAGGSLGAGTSTNVTVSTNANINALVGGLYSNRVSFVNATNGNGTTNFVWTLLVRDGISDDWRQQYFGHIEPEASDQSRAQDDPDGDGCDNLCEFQAGTDPTDAASYFHITAVTAQGNNALLTWAAGLGRTNVVQASAGLPSGSYSTNFSDVSPWIILPAGSGPTTTNYLHAGAMTNSPALYYRIRLQQ